ncbi:MAG: metallopeptidase TldD-related protein [Candidatus Dormibacteria bacterium]
MSPEEVVETAISEGEVAVALANSTVSQNFRLANNTVTTNGIEISTSCGLVAVEGDAVGVETADVQGRAELLALARAAREAARTNPPAPDAMPLLSPEEAAAPGPVEVEEGWDLGGVVEPLRLAIEESRSRGEVLYGYVHGATSHEALGSRAGVRLAAATRFASISLTLKTGDLKRSAWCGRMAEALDGIDVGAMYRGCLERLAWTRRQLSLEPGHYQVILEPSAVADMVVRLAWEMHARGADEERTVFASKAGSRVGEAMYAPSITLTSNPKAAGMRVPDFVRVLSSSEYGSVFDNGLPAPKTTWIDRGVQRELICPRRWARDHGHPVRPDPENLRLAGNGASLEEMIAGTERALLVTSLWYIRDVDPATLLLTGLTRDGVYLVEKGKVVGAVNNFRFNESPVGVLNRTVEVGRPELALSREIGDMTFVEVPPLRVERFFMSSVSDAI